MGKYQAYPEYKDASGNWMGKVPSHWTITSLKRVCDLSTGLTPPTSNEANYVDYDSGFSWVRPEDLNEGQAPTTASKFLSKNGWELMRVVPKSSTLICCIGTIGKAGYVQKDVSTNQQITSASFHYSPKYNYYLVKAAREVMEETATGNVIQILNSERLGGIPFLLLPKSEADKIANFLDHETAKIDTLIDKQQQLIQLLKEKRQAVISHAVTKGLNPNAPMRDSGVEWLGEVPEHWVLARLKNVLRIRNGRDYKDVEVEEGGYPVYGSGGIFKRSSSYLYDGKSVLFGRKGTIDKPLVVSGKFWTVDTMFYSEVFDNVLPEYIYYQATFFPFNLLSTNTALPSMTQEDLLMLPFVVPPRIEQEGIIKYVQDKSARFDNLIGKAQSAIELMQERRTALISAAVTGKIDVRHHASRPAGGLQPSKSTVHGDL